MQYIKTHLFKDKQVKKETKTLEDGCSRHLILAIYSPSLIKIL